MRNVCGRGNPRGNLFHFIGLIILIGASSCGKLPGYEVNNKQDGYTADIAANPNIDLLFVIDNSPSMQPEQAILEGSFESFISNFTDKGLQYHIGIISTDTCPYDHTCDPTGPLWWDPANIRYQGINNQGRGTLLSKYAFNFIPWNLDPHSLENSKALTITDFRNNASLGIFGSGAEAGLLSAKFALDNTTYNSGFLRPDSFLSIIDLTDEDESYGYGGRDPAIPGEEYHLVADNVTKQNNRIIDFLNAVIAKRGSNLDNFSFHGIGNLPGATECVVNGIDQSPFSPAVTISKTVDVIKAAFPPLGGGLDKATFTNICQDFSPALNDIALSIIQANASYKLEQPPADPTAIKVYVNGTIVPRSVSNGWEYDEPNNAIQFYGTAIPNVGDRIIIDYVPGAPR